jgi:hypothetical protein
MSAFIPGQGPAGFAIAAILGISTVIFGSHWIRISGATLSALAVIFIILEVRSALEDKRIAREVQQMSLERAAKAAELRRKLESITIADGISKPEAEVIAQCYFSKNVGCGAFTGIRDGGAFWVVEGVFGYGANPIRDFHIDKTSGNITSPVDPRHVTLTQILK